MTLLSCPGLGFVEHGDVAADLQVVAVELIITFFILFSFYSLMPKKPRARHLL